MTAVPLPLLFLATSIVAGLSPFPSPSTQCASEIVSLSPCLSYISFARNDASDRCPTSSCCDAFSLYAVGSGAACLCHLIRDPIILGFPVNSTWVFELLSKCAGRGEANVAEFRSLCFGPGEIPPLRSQIPTTTTKGKNNDTDISSSPAPLGGFPGATDADSNDGKHQKKAPTAAPVDIHVSPRSSGEKLYFWWIIGLVQGFTLFYILHVQ